MIHGSKTAGGISHVLIPTTNLTNKPPTRIHLKHILDPLLLNRNISHFSQAHKTPFTIQPILHIFGENGCTQEALDALNRNIPHNITKHSKILLQHMQMIREPLPLSKWREQTTTSPSNKHLGVYKSLLNAMKYNLHTDHETTNQIVYTEKYNNTHQPNAIPIAGTALKIQFYLMTLAVQHCHTYHQWQLVHNFLIKKTWYSAYK
jgi:hypothetical protein